MSSIGGRAIGGCLQRAGQRRPDANGIGGLVKEREDAAAPQLRLNRRIRIRGQHHHRKQRLRLGEQLVQSNAGRRARPPGTKVQIQQHEVNAFGSQNARRLLRLRPPPAPGRRPSDHGGEGAARPGHPPPTEGSCSPFPPPRRRTVLAASDRPRPASASSHEGDPGSCRRDAPDGMLPQRIPPDVSSSPSQSVFSGIHHIRPGQPTIGLPPEQPEHVSARAAGMDGMTIIAAARAPTSFQVGFSMTGPLSSCRSKDAPISDVPRRKRADRRCAVEVG